MSKETLVRRTIRIPDYLSNMLDEFADGLAEAKPELFEGKSGVFSHSMRLLLECLLVALDVTDENNRPVIPIKTAKEIMRDTLEVLNGVDCTYRTVANKELGGPNSRHPDGFRDAMKRIRKNIQELREELGDVTF